ncbi:MAG TPA: hypothetical protein VND93_19485 [Myxococcales bacterium]|nr:hypothetical protein [Myxococcales bacterium]
MTQTLRLPVLAAALLSGAAFAQGLSGTWTAKDVTITLSQSEDQIEGSLVTDRKNIPIAGVVEGNQAFGEVTGPNGSMPFTLTLTGQAMKFQMTGPDGKALTFFLKRSKGGAAAAPAPAPEHGAQAAPPAQPAAPALPEKGAVAGAKGGLWKNDTEGWSVNGPPGWKGGEQKDGSILLGHDTEWGILRIAHQIGTRLEDARAQGENGFTFEGVMFTPTAPLAQLRVKAGTALAGTYEGQTLKGPYRIHNVALQGPLGILVLSGMAPVSNYGKMTQNVEAMAASATFFKGKAGIAVQHVAGRWWHWHGSSSVSYGTNGNSSFLSSEKKLWLCSDGRFSRAGSFSADVTTNSAWGTANTSGARDSSADGRWTAIGTPQAGKIIVTLNNGTREEMGYQVAAQGDKWQMYIDGTGYLISNDLGGCQ